MGRKPEEITVWKIDRRRSNLVEYDASSDGELFQLSERERETVPVETRSKEQ